MNHLVLFVMPCRRSLNKVCSCSPRDLAQEDLLRQPRRRRRVAQPALGRQFSPPRLPLRRLPPPPGDGRRRHERAQRRRPRGDGRLLAVRPRVLRPLLRRLPGGRRGLSALLRKVRSPQSLLVMGQTVGNKIFSPHLKMKATYRTTNELNRFPCSCAGGLAGEKKTERGRGFFPITEVTKAHKVTSQFDTHFATQTCTYRSEPKCKSQQVRLIHSF